MKLEFLSKSLDYKGGEPYKTRVVLGNSEGVIYPAFFDPDFVSKESGELFKLALEQIYQENFPKKQRMINLTKLTNNCRRIKKLLVKQNKQQLKISSY